jgi:hypothetical protein
MCTSLRAARVLSVLALHLPYSLAPVRWEEAINEKMEGFTYDTKCP